MRGHATNTLRALLFLVPTLIAWTPANPILTLTPQSRLWVNGTSTVRSFECKATSFTAQIEAAGTGAIDAVLAGDKGVAAVAVEVPAAKLDCGNGTMNEHMLKALKADKAPVISFQLASYEMTKAGTALNGRLQGTLTMGGVTKPVTLIATGKEEEGGLHVTGTHDVRMTEWGLKPPTLMMGTMKVGEQVKVSFDLFLKG